jgi:hypothetical protein
VKEACIWPALLKPKGKKKKRYNNLLLKWT